VVVANGTPYVIDRGDGVARQHFDGTIVLGRDLMEL
jgi:serine/threonine-protein kinase RIO1